MLRTLRSCCWLALAVVALTTAGISPATAAMSTHRASCGGRVTTFVPPAGTNTPFGITAGPGGMYVAHGATIDRITGSRITELPLPDADTANAGWLAWDGHSSFIWFADRGVGAIGTITAAGSYVAYPIPAGVDGAALPQSLVLGPRFVFFTDQNNDRIGRFDETTRRFRFWTVPTPDSSPLGMVRGRDGDLYFTERSADKVGRFDPRTALFTEWSLTTGAFPNRLAVTPDGSVWFTELHTSAIARIDPNGHLHQYPVTGGPVGLTYLHGRLYAAMYTTGQLAEIDLQGRVIQSWTLPGAVGLLQVGTRHGSVWIADGFGDHVYRIEVCR